MTMVLSVLVIIEKTKDRQYHGHNRKNKRTDNTMVIMERKEGQTTP
jgi:hypothetical protein